MSERENPQALQRAYKAFAEGHISVLLDTLTDDVDWNFPPSSAEIPWAQHAWRGRDGVARGFRKLAELVEIEVFAPDEFIVGQDSVVVLGYERSKMRKTGRSFKGNWAAVFTFRDGQICRYREYHHTSALDAAYRGFDSQTRPAVGQGYQLPKEGRPKFSSMEEKGRSVTAECGAIQRVLHQTLDAAPKILDDPIAPLLLDLASESNKANIARVESMTRPVKSPFRAVFIMRSRYTEDCRRR